MFEFRSNTEEDIKKWINDQLQRDPQEETITRLILKLQILGQDLEKGVDTSSKQLLAAVPKCAKEISKLHTEAELLKSDLKSILQDAVEVDKRTQESVQFLGEIDFVKRRMETVEQALSEVDNWRKRTQTVRNLMEDESLAEIDEPIEKRNRKIADELFAMGRSLDLLKDLPEFTERKEEHASLCSEFEASITSHLLEALNSHDITKLTEYAQIFKRIDREASVRRHYFTSRLESAQRLCDSFAGPRSSTNSSRPSSASSAAKTLSDWLPELLASLLELIQQESQWSAQIFTDSADAVLKALLDELFSEFVPQLTIWTQGYAQQKGPKSIDGVLAIFKIVSNFVEKLPKTMHSHPHSRSSSKSPHTPSPSPGHSHASSQVGMSNSPRGKRPSLLAHAHSPSIGNSPRPPQAEERTGVDVAKIVSQAVLKAFTSFFTSYSNLEAARLSGTFKDMDWVAANASSKAGKNLLAMTDVEHILDESCSRVVSSGQNAIDRCLTLSGGILYEELGTALNRFLVQYFQHLFTLMSRLYSICAFHPDNVSGSSLSTKQPASSRSTSSPSGKKSGRQVMSDKIKYRKADDADSSQSSASSLLEASFDDLFDDSPSSRANESKRAEDFDWASELRGSFKLLTAVRKIRREIDNLESSIAASLSPSVQSLLRAVDDSLASRGTPLVHAYILHIAYISTHRSKVNSMRALVQDPADHSNADGDDDSPAAAAEALKPRKRLLHGSLQICSQFQNRLRRLTFDTMIFQIRAALNRICHLSQWSNVKSKKAAVLKIPEFSMQPSQYMTRVGHHLLALVQQLEPHEQQNDPWEDLSTPKSPAALSGGSGAKMAGDSENDDESQQATDSLYWMTEVYNGTIHLLMAQVQRIPYLSQRGAKQLAADIEYLANLGDALGVQANHFLASILRILQAEKRSDAVALLSSMEFDGADERKVAERVVAILKPPQRAPAAKPGQRSVPSSAHK